MKKDHITPTPGPTQQPARESSRAGPDSRVVIAGMVLLAIVSGVLAIAYLRGLSRRSMELWGTSGELVLRAPQVEAWRLDPASNSNVSADEHLAVEHQTLAVLEQLDISQARGLINVRRGLLRDASYAWDENLSAPGRWEYALHFKDGDREATVLFSIDPPLAMLHGSPRRVSIAPVSSGLQTFFQEQFTRVQ